MNTLSVDSLKLDSQLCFKLYAASRAVIRAYKPMLDQLGLTYPQYLAMLVLWEWQETAPEQPTVKALEQRRQSAGIQRQRSARDEREVHLSLSPTGKALRDQVGPLKARLLCDSGVDLDRLHDLRDGLDHLLGQIKALS